MRLPGTSAQLFLAILAACAVVLTANGIASRLSFERDFMGYLNEQGLQRMREVLPRVAQAYREHGNWDFLRGQPQAWFELMRPERQAGQTDPSAMRAPSVSDQTGAVPRFALLDAQGRWLAGNPGTDSTAIRLPVRVSERGSDTVAETVSEPGGGEPPVGWLAMVPFQQAIAEGDVRFYQAQRRAWWLNGVVSVLVAAALAWLLSRALLGRVRGLTDSIHRLAAGDYAHRAARAGGDELGRLAADVNQLAAALENTERNRRAFMADISHELRTPLAVLRAELEAIQDGIRPLTQAALASLHGEVQQLGQLIDDLGELAVTQAGEMSYRFAPLDLDGVLHNTLAGMRGRFADAGLTLDAEPAGTPQRVRGDERRLQQLFANLLENALRYTARGGRVAVRVSTQGGQVEAVVEDSAPGVEPAHRARLFERFYRVEGSRNRASGGSGLGLAICRNIVEAHGGEIRAQDSPLGGLRITARFPEDA
ncbi:MAG: sensor histidine kinase efflux regulator BaeS [Comamonas sp.]